MLATSSRIGADETTWAAENAFHSPSAVTAPMVQRLVCGFQRRLSRTVPMCKRPPRAFTCAAAASHIMPGPLRGYWKESISVLICCWPSFLGMAPRGSELRRALDMALHRSRPLIRCAAQSAEISSQLMPHTFSVYVLKKIENRRSPNWLATQSWKLSGLAVGKACLLRYERTHSADST